jgi:signal peptidase II
MLKSNLPKADFWFIRKWAVFFGISTLVLTLDQWSKIYIDFHYQVGETRPIIENIFHFTYVRNFGAAFGFLAQANSGFRDQFFLIMPVFASFILIWFCAVLQPHEFRKVCFLAMVLGGALGNYLDRLRVGYVIDFLDLHYDQVWTWPTFNFADVAIVIGITGLIVILLKETWAEDLAAKT